MSYARRTDATHREVLDTLRSLGWQIVDTSRLAGFIDAVAWHQGRQHLRLVEIKDVRGNLTLAQVRLLQAGWPIHVLRSAADAINL